MPGLACRPSPQPTTGPPSASRSDASCSWTGACPRNGTMSCGMCHVPEQGFTVNELTTAVGIDGRSLRRNAPTLLNVGYNTSLFHDGRARTLEEQAWGPLLAGDEMGNSSRDCRGRSGRRPARLRRVVRAGLSRAWARRRTRSARPWRPISARWSRAARASTGSFSSGERRRAERLGTARLRSVPRRGALRRLPHAGRQQHAVHRQRVPQPGRRARQGGPLVRAGERPARAGRARPKCRRRCWTPSSAHPPRTRGASK